MNITIQTFLDIIKAALAGRKPHITREISQEEWQRLFQLAGLHNVLPLIYEAVYTLPELQKHPALLASMKRQIRQLVILQTMRTTDFLKLNRHMQAAGIRPLVVKGIVCRNLYPLPDHRPSSDEDVLIAPAESEACHLLLTEFGMQTAETPETRAEAYEVPYQKADSPLYIELHKHLFPPESDAYGDLNRFFENVRDRAVALEIQGTTVWTLGYTDHLFYLICHAFKHFLHSGFGIRQVCDILLFAQAYGSRIDWSQVLKNCRAIHADKFAAAVFQIGSRHLGFDAEKASYPPIWQDIAVDELPMLADLLSGGLYGDASLSRKHSSNITLDAVAARKQGRKTKGALLTSVFPSAAKLENRYPYLEKHPYLLPVAWCSRLWQYARETAHTPGSKASAALKIGNERIALLRMYEIIE